MSRTRSVISVRLDCESVCDDIDPLTLKRLARQVCRRFKTGRAMVNIFVVDDKTIRSVHKKFFGTAKTTDVVSYDLSGPLEKSKFFDVIINVERARRQAAKRSHSAQAETALYLVHGLLHQFGFDDATAAKAWRMHRQEDEILREAGFGNVYHSTRKG